MCQLRRVFGACFVLMLILPGCSTMAHRAALQDKDQAHASPPSPAEWSARMVRPCVKTGKRVVC